MNFYGIIYKATNKINGKVYIGQTIQTLHTRKLRHIRDAKNGGNAVFCKAIRKYGQENFDWEIIDTCSNPQELNEKEIYWINKYNSFVNSINSNGYNMKIGGHGLYGDYATRNKLTTNDILELFKYAETGKYSASELAFTFNVSTSQILLILKLSTGWNNIIFNYYNKDELDIILEKVCTKGRRDTSIKLSKNKTGENHHMWGIKGKDNRLSKPVFQIDLITNDIIREFDSITEASKYVNACNCSKIAMVCRGERKKAYGFKWEFKYKNT